ncbi:response regulator [Nisaea acidiphila]|uniref:Response regulator n=1 Tax=Nisaea acidiphila TaxID=1862145 RepID=A0A9J7AU23_9PROT|nr:response regulator [Nisaea acidiphila]UUX51219.1 response regulator [Nisaea acidiphila]
MNSQTDPLAAIRPNFSEFQVIVAEDEPMATKLAQGSLKLMGFKRIFHAPDGLKALKILRELDGDVQLIVSDWNMPEINGLEFLKAVRKIFPKMKFIMLTGNANKDFVIEARRAGVDAYIAKPFTPDQLKAKVEAIFKL